MRDTSLKLLLLVTVLSVSVAAQAIVIRHDRADFHYVVDENDYPQLFYLQTRYSHKVCLATLIASRWAITAAHCTDDTPIQSTLALKRDYSLKVNGQQYRISRLVVHPDYVSGHYLEGVDLALIELDRPVPDVQPIRLNRSTDELHQVVQLLGWGYTGDGRVGRRGNDGKLRRAENVIDSANEWLEFHFDDPRREHSLALNLEGVPGLGDSGGPALLDTGNGPLLLGIAVGELDNPAAQDREGLYGATEVYERISRHLEWIDKIIEAR